MPRYYYGIFIAKNKSGTYEIRVKPENLHGQYVTDRILLTKSVIVIEMCIKIDGKKLNIYYITKRQQNDSSFASV